MFKSQNNPENIKLLKAINFYYSKAKKIKLIMICVSIFIPISFLTLRYLKNVESIKFDNDSIIIYLALIWIVISYFLDKLSNNLILTASKIQEQLDVKLFKLDKNDTLFLKDVNEETIYEGIQNFKGNTDKLKDWYGDKYLDVNHNLKVLIAQRMNIIWGNELKKKFSFLLYIVLIVVILLPLALALSKNLIINDTLLFLALPMIPIYVMIFNSISKINKQISMNESIDKKILHDCNNLNEKTKDKCRQYQDYIYKENRVNSILIPDCFFKINRDSMNNKIIQTNNDLLNRYSLTECPI
jgi:hypothetical protein